MLTARDIANWFLSRESMTHKKLQKLCYYAQAWYCALYSEIEPLFDDTVEAWVHGPVIPTLYPIYADYKWNPIPKAEVDESKFSQQALEILEAVYNTYGEFSGDELEALTHSERPWQDARGNLKSWETSHTPISRVSMKEYYGKKYDESQND